MVEDGSYQGLIPISGVRVDELTYPFHSFFTSITKGLMVSSREPTVSPNPNLRSIANSPNHSHLQKIQPIRDTFPTWRNILTKSSVSQLASGVVL
jgi:hypothetical protein